MMYIVGDVFTLGATHRSFVDALQRFSVAHLEAFFYNAINNPDIMADEKGTFRLHVSGHRSLFCLQVTTYGRRTRNVVPIFVPIDNEKDDDHQTLSGEGDEASGIRLDMRVNPRGCASPLSLVHSASKVKTPKTLRVVPNLIPTSKVYSR